MSSKGRSTRCKSTMSDHEEVPDVAPAWLQKFTADMLVSMKKMIDESTAGIASKSIEKLEVTSAKHSALLHHMKKQHDQLNERVIKLESRSMRDNLIFCGVKEEDGNVNLENKLSGIIEDELKISGVNIIRCHRLPKPRKDRSNDRPRNVVVKLADNADVQRILSSAKLLKGREPPLYIHQQYPKEIVTRRRILQPVLYAAKDANLKASLVEDRLYIDSVLYTVENVCDVPFDISKLNENRNDSTVAFLGRLSPLSNFYPAPFSADEEHFTCVEQYYQYKKAVIAQDKDSCAAIMSSSDPLDIKRTGDAITMKPDIKKSWMNSNIKLMTEALTHKFQQNKLPREALLATQKRKLVEASYDRFWGCGKPLRDPDCLVASKWSGKNNMGTLLETVRVTLSDS